MIPIPIFVDGGDPIGVLPGDSLGIVASGNAVGVLRRPRERRRRFSIGASQPLTFDHIESVGPIVGPGPVLIVGTNADDDITIIARDSASTPQFPGTDGNQDFTVSVNAGPDILFVDTPTVQRRRPGRRRRRRRPRTRRRTTCRGA